MCFQTDKETKQTNAKSCTTSDSLAWSAESIGVFLYLTPKNSRHIQILRHKIGLKKLLRQHFCFIYSEIFSTFKFLFLLAGITKMKTSVHLLVTKIFEPWTYKLTMRGGVSLYSVPSTQERTLSPR